MSKKHVFHKIYVVSGFFLASLLCFYRLTLIRLKFITRLHEVKFKSRVSEINEICGTFWGYDIKAMIS